MATDFHFSFISLLSISCFLISFFFFPFFFVSFCHSPHLSLISFVFTSFFPVIIIFLCSFRFLCRFCLVAFASLFCEPIFVSNLLFFLLCPFVFSPPFIFFLSFDFHELRRRRRRRSVSKRNITCADASVTATKKDHSPSREG